MSVVLVKPARASVFLVALITLGFGRKAKGNDAFECPVKCSTDVYRPICLRGKSYANLCVLQRDICSGKIARELYEDVEACPGYEKDEEANGASVEAIDKNGVLFRNLIDRPAKTASSPPAADVPHAKPIDLSANRRSSRLGGRQCERLERMRICRQTCFNDEIYRRPVRVLGVSSHCCIKFLACECRAPCRCRSSVSSGALDVDGPHRFVRKTCRVNCDPNEDQPICTGRHVFLNECHPTKVVCGGSIRRP